MGGGSGEPSSDELRSLEQIAKNKLRENAGPSRRNVFISFASDDLNEVNLLRGQAKNDNSELEFIDRSLQKPFNSEDAQYIKRGISERIKQASVTMCYITENTADSEWVDWEIRESIRLNKGVIAVYSGDKPPKRLPTAITENNISLIPWNHDAIMAAVNKASETRNSSD